EEDALFFFGRERERQILAKNLRAARLTILYGESGAGKSSLLRAGVAHDLIRRARENLDERGQPELAVVVFNNWRDDPVAELKAEVERAVAQAFSGLAVAPMSLHTSLAETLRQGAERVGGWLLVILDQFEDYYLHNHQEHNSDTFA